ncbi:DUF2142 domain-containing protein [Microcella sp.]|uniref:DUF2142 domain-containing protein n=1 Tax=Microcella sp. TaxID=1913979 RepID=UPI00391D0F0A
MNGLRDRLRAAWRRPGVAGGMLALLTALTLGSWALASPIGAGPDDDFHLISTWCAGPAVDELCADGSTPQTRQVPRPLLEAPCFAYDPEESAACQLGTLDWSGVGPGGAVEIVETSRGNFGGEYPPLYYAVNGILSGANAEAAALAMRAVTIALFLVLATALHLLLPARLVPALHGGLLVTMVPLGVFLFGTNNPSAWAVIGVATSAIALLGYFETSGRRKLGLAAVFVVGVIMAAGSRADAAVFAGFGIAVMGMLAAAPTKRFVLDAILPAITGLVALGFFLAAGQASSGTGGFGGPIRDATGSEGGDVSAAIHEAAEPTLGGVGLLFYNVLNVPFIWSGAWGEWGLGWLDTSMPAVVPLAGIAAFVALGFVALRGAGARVIGAVAVVVAALWAVPVYVLQAGGTMVPDQVQPRYLLPLIVLLGVLLLVRRENSPLTLTRSQRWVLVAAVAGAHFVALHMNLRRYVTGTDEPGPYLDAGLEWWWAWMPVGPSVIWLVGSLAFVGVAVVATRAFTLAQPVTVR